MGGPEDAPDVCLLLDHLERGRGAAGETRGDAGGEGRVLPQLPAAAREGPDCHPSPHQVWFLTRVSHIHHQLLPRAESS